MDSKKAILILGLLAMILIISEVSAKDLTETSSNTQKEVVEQTNEVNDAKYGSYNGGYPGRGGNYGPGYPGNGRGNGGYPGRRGGYCRYGCCGGGYRSCRRCCSYANEAVAMQTMDKTHN